MVLLKNEGILPLNKFDKVAYIGIFADKPRIQGGGSSNVNCTKIVGAVEAAKAANAYDFIKELPLQFGTYLEEAGNGLSGGEKQRLIMARQLAKQPKALLLDEPATMACPKTKQEILDAVKKINKELNITVILVSHLPDVQKYLADRVILLEDGEIADEGSPKEICDKFMEDMDDIADIENISTDEDVIGPLLFLRQREVVHFQRFGEGLRMYQEQLDSKNFYAFNPSFDKHCMKNCKNRMK